MYDAPLSLTNRSQVFFQRFTVAEVHTNLSPGHNHLVDTKNEQATTKLTDTFLGVVAIKAF